MLGCTVQSKQASSITVKDLGVSSTFAIQYTITAKHIYKLRLYPLTVSGYAETRIYSTVIR